MGLTNNFMGLDKELIVKEVLKNEELRDRALTAYCIKVFEGENKFWQTEQRFLAEQMFANTN